MRWLASRSYQSVLLLTEYLKIIKYTVVLTYHKNMELQDTSWDPTLYKIQSFEQANLRLQHLLKIYCHWQILPSLEAVVWVNWSCEMTVDESLSGHLERQS